MAIYPKEWRDRHNYGPVWQGHQVDWSLQAGRGRRSSIWSGSCCTSLGWRPISLAGSRFPHRNKRQTKKCLDRSQRLCQICFCDGGCSFNSRNYMPLCCLRKRLHPICINCRWWTWESFGPVLYGYFDVSFESKGILSRKLCKSVFVFRL